MKKNNEKEIKDIEYKVAQITIKRIKEQFKDGAVYENKPKVITLKIQKENSTMSTAFKDSKTGRNELLKTIKRELYF